MSEKHRSELCENVLPLLKKFFKFLNVVQIPATCPQAGAQAPSKRDQPQPPGHHPHSLWLSQGRSGPAWLPGPLNGGPPQAVNLGLGCLTFWKHSVDPLPPHLG